MQASASLRSRVESGFEAWAGWVYQRAWWVLGLWLVIFGLLLPQATQNSIDVDIEAMLTADDPSLLRYQEFKRQFGRDDATLLAFEPADPFDLEFLTWLRQLHHAIEDELPYLDEVTSLINARVTRGEGDELIVEELFEDWPPSPERLAFAREYARTNPFYQNLLLSRDHRVTIMVVELSEYPAGSDDALEGFEEIPAENGADGSTETLRLNGLLRNETMRVLVRIIEENRRPDLEVLVSGEPLTAQHTGDETQKGMGQFTALALLGISVILILLFRRLSGAMVPITIALLTIGCAFGAAGIRGSPLNVTAQMIPSLLLAVNTSSSIHLLFIFFQSLDQGASREQALRAAYGHSALPVVFANLTTAGGLFSFVVAKTQAVRDIGVIVPIGIAIGLVLCLTLLPALLAVLPLRRKASGGALTRPGFFQKRLVATADLAARRPWTTIACCLAVATIAIAGTHRLQLTFYPVEFVAPDDPLVTATAYLNEKFANTSSLEVIIDTGRENGLHDPALLSALNGLYDRTSELRGGFERELRVGKALSYVDILKEIHRALNENRAEFYTVPTERSLAAQELLLFENSGSDDLEEFVDSQFSMARFTLRVPYEGGEKYIDFVSDARALFEEELPDDVSVHVTGSLELFVTTVVQLGEGLVSSYTMALLIITPLMMLLIGSVRAGLVSMIPNLLPIGMSLGLIGWFSGELSLITVLIGGIAIGLAVDDTIHVFHQFHRYFGELGDARAAIHETMKTTGLALLTTTTVLSAGFFVYASSALPMLQWMGWALMASILLAFLADILLAPALLSLLYRKS